MVFGGAIGAALGVVFAPRLGESRRAALERLRIALRPGRDSLDAFAGTLCSMEVRSGNESGRVPGAAESTSRGDDG